MANYEKGKGEVDEEREQENEKRHDLTFRAVNWPFGKARPVRPRGETLW